MPPEHYHRDDVPLERRVELLESMMSAEERRMDRAVDELPGMVKQAVLDALKERPQMSEEEHEYLKIATKAAAQRVKYRQAVIEKTLGAVIWLALAGVATAVWRTIVNLINSPVGPK
jgi:hypothetical protein